MSEEEFTREEMVNLLINVYGKKRKGLITNTDDKLRLCMNS